MKKSMELESWLHTDELLHVVQLHLRERLHILDLTPEVAIVLAIDPREGPQNLLRRQIKRRLSLRKARRRSLRCDAPVALFQPDEDRLGRVGFVPVDLEVSEDLDGLIGRGGPDEAEFGEGDG